MRDFRERLLYLSCAIVVVLLGLASRRYGANLPVFVAQYAGDTLWALMVFLGLSVLIPSARASHRGAMALAFAFAIELSQLYHAPWIDALRRTTLGGLVLGFGFLGSDLICYAIGVLIGVAVEASVRSRPSRPVGDGNAEAM